MRILRIDGGCPKRQGKQCDFYLKSDPETRAEICDNPQYADLCGHYTAKIPLVGLTEREATEYAEAKLTMQRGNSIIEFGSLE